MSVDSAALERSALERKDREELLTIAKALGGKPGSRAKKADIIDVILELTGVGVPATDEAKQDYGAKQDAKSGDDAAADAAEEPPAEWEQASLTDESAEPEATSSDKQSNQSGGREAEQTSELQTLRRRSYA